MSIETILDEFDFYKVERAMQALDWKWAGVDGVPSIGDMRRQARRLLSTVRDAPDESADYSAATGGFKATRRLYPGDSKVYLSLEFIVASWDNHEAD